MSTGLDSPPEQSTASLLTGILGDLQQLVEQQLRLARREILDDLRERGIAVSLLAVGVSVIFLDAIVGCLTFAHLLHWIASPATTDPASLPLWGCYGVTSIVLTLLGCVLIQSGKNKLATHTVLQKKIIDIQQE